MSSSTIFNNDHDDSKPGTSPKDYQRRSRTITGSRIFFITIALLPLVVMFFTPATLRTSISSTLRQTVRRPAFFSTTNHTLHSAKMSAPFLQAVQERRTYYALEAKSPITDKKIVEIVQHAVKHVPSSFNSQSTRALVLLKDHHKKLWGATHDILEKIVPAESFTGTAKKIAGFNAAYGTVVFFIDQSAVKSLQDAFPTYSDRFPQWAEHSDGMHQFVVWTALEKEGFGANLQHYNPLIDEKVKEEWNIPADWKITSTLVFGTPIAGTGPGEKTFKPIDERVKVFGADE